MTQEELFVAIGEAGDAWVQAAGTPPRAAKRRRWPIAVAAAVVVFLVACGVQQGWFQFLTPAQWRGNGKNTEKSFVYRGSAELGAETIQTVIQDGTRQVQFTSQLLTREGFQQAAAANGWPLNWAALADQGEFSGMETPCWAASQLQVDRNAGGITLTGTPQDIPLQLTGSWTNDLHTSVTVSFALADGQEPMQFRIGEDTALTQLEATGWNEPFFVSDEAVAGQDGAVALAWRPLDKTRKDIVSPRNALEEPPKAQDMNRCVLTVYFQGYEPEEARRLAQELLKSA